jgi:hypothetical protein
MTINHGRVIDVVSSNPVASLFHILWSVIILRIHTTIVAFAQTLEAAFLYARPVLMCYEIPANALRLASARIGEYFLV